MRYVFIINPKAGKKNPYEWYFPQVREYFWKKGLDFSYCLTQYPWHAAELSRKEAQRGDLVRLIAVGGDGTLLETANGAMGYENAEIGILPCGSGNDYIRSFGSQKEFFDYTALERAKSICVDMIGSENVNSLNICSMGLDASVAMNMAKYKDLPLISGSMAYHIAVAKEFLGKLGTEMEVVIDGVHRVKGKFLFALAANGKFYGGGYRAAPMASEDDGLLDFIMIRVPKHRYSIPRLLIQYKNGTYVNSKEFEQLVAYYRGKRIEIRACRDIAANCDGECRKTKSLSFSVLPRAARFLLPESCYLRRKEERMAQL